MNNKIHQGRADYFLKQAAYELLQATDIEIENAKDNKFGDFRFSFLQLLFLFRLYLPCNSLKKLKRVINKNAIQPVN